MNPQAIDTENIRGRIRGCPDCGRRFSGEASFCPFDGVPLVADDDHHADPFVGATIDGRYEVTEFLGEGGMGRVYRVRHTALERSFAMKVLRRDLASNQDLGARFLHEARATAAVKHPNVVQITDFGRLPDEAPYFVMELLVGRTLAQALHGAPFPPERIVPILRQVASALGAAHAAGVIHRDLKPDNVFVLGEPGPQTDGGEAPASSPAPAVRVVDFGAAKILGSDRITRTGIVFGTPHYMSPEQARGLAVDHRADVYALGVILYEMLAGRVPFQGETFMGVLSQHMFVVPTPPTEFNPEVADFRALEAIALRCLAKSPDERFESMAALVSALDAAEKGPAAALAYVPEVTMRSATANEEHVAAGAPRVASSRGPSAAAAATRSAPPPPPFDRAWFVLVGGLLGGALLALAAWMLVPAFGSPKSVATPPAGPTAAAVTAVARVPASVTAGALTSDAASAPPSLLPPSEGVRLAPSAAPPSLPAAPAASLAPPGNAPRHAPARPAGRSSRGKALDDVGDPFSPHGRPAP